MDFVKCNVSMEEIDVSNGPQECVRL